jgi:hypothetical protein
MARIFGDSLVVALMRELGWASSPSVRPGRGLPRIGGAALKEGGGRQDSRDQGKAESF